MTDMTQKTLVGLLIACTVLLIATLIIPTWSSNVEGSLFTDPDSNHFSVPTGKPFEVTCRGDSGHFSDLTWLDPQGDEIKDGTPRVQHIESNSLKLLFSDPATAHSGVYVCMATINKEQLELHVTISFYGSVPQFDADYENILVEEGYLLEVDCYATGDLPLKYAWYDPSENLISSRWNNSIVFSRDSINGSTLIFDGVEVHHGGVYTCTASNSYGLTSKLYEVTVVPSSHNETNNDTQAIRHVHTLEVTATSVRFGILTSGRVDSIEVRYRESREDWETLINMKRSNSYDFKDLIPAGRYTFRFRVNNGSDWTNVDVTLLPDKPEVIFLSLNEGQLKIQIVRKFDEIMRETIDKYQLAYYTVQMQGGNYWKPSTCVTTIEYPTCAGTTYTIAALSRRIYYEIQLRAHTSAGYGEAYKHMLYLQ